MAAIAMIFGSIFGFFGAMTGWIVFDATFMTTAAIYLGTSLSLALIAITAQTLSPTTQDAQASFA